MAVIKSGDLVVLKSGGPTMTVDAVNTDIFDDDKITGVLCVWFVGEKFERARFDHRALEPAQLQEASPGKKDPCPEEATGDYKVVLDEMAAAMNILAEAEKAQFEITPVSGEGIEKLLADVLRTPPAIAERAGALVK